LATQRQSKQEKERRNISKTQVSNVKQTKFDLFPTFLWLEPWFRD